MLMRSRRGQYTIVFVKIEFCCTYVLEVIIKSLALLSVAFQLFVLITNVSIKDLKNYKMQNMIKHFLTVAIKPPSYGADGKQEVLFRKRPCKPTLNFKGKF